MAIARRTFVLEGDLHYVYHLTPVFHNIEPDWNRFGLIIVLHIIPNIIMKSFYPCLRNPKF